MSGRPILPISPATASVRAGVDSDVAFGAVVPPIVLSSNFSFEALGTPRTHDYTRSGNPTRDQLVEALAKLEGAAGGVVTSSGMSAILVALYATPRRRGGPPRVLAPTDGYGGTFRLFTSLAERNEIELEWIDAWQTDALVESIERFAPDLVWLETPSNPLLRITDLRAAIEAAHAHGAVVAVDNTFLSPALQTPLALGADVVVHSTTKYINGHSDVVGGAVLARERKTVESVAFWANCLGVTGAPFDSFLTLRGLRTLHLRVRQHEENAAAIVAALEECDAITAIHYPGRAEHPGHAIARSQQRGFGGMISFELAGGRPAVERFVTELRSFTLAESLGGVESLVCHPATMTHAAITADALERAGICDSLIRLSVGIEDGADLVADLTRAIAVSTSRRSTFVRAPRPRTEVRK